MDYSKNKCEYDATNNLAYSYSTENNSPYLGIQLLSQNQATPFAIDNVAGGGSGGVDVSSGFSKSEKYTVLSNYNPIAGNVGIEGNDILSSLSYGPFSLTKDSSLVVAFAISAADSLTELRSLSEEIKTIYIRDRLDQFTVNRTPPKTYSFQSKVFPNPSKGLVTIEITLENDGEIEVIMHNSLGQEVLTIQQSGYYDYNAITFDSNNFGQGVYFLTIKADLQEAGYQVYCLRGNHEQMILDVLRRWPLQLKAFLKKYGSADLLNKEGRLRSKVFDFLQECLYYIELDDYYLVHAGFDFKAEKPLKSFSKMLSIRKYTPDYEKINFKKIVHGHYRHSLSYIERQVLENKMVLPIDNGCSSKKIKDQGNLICLNLDTLEITTQRNIESSTKALFK